MAGPQLHRDSLRCQCLPVAVGVPDDAVVGVGASRPIAGTRRDGPGTDGPLRVALLGYRADPRCGGQGVYLRQLSRALVRAGHLVTVLAGPPYPELDPGVGYVPLPSLGWNPPPTGATAPVPRRSVRSWPDVVEAGYSWSGRFGEPAGFARRVRRALGEVPGGVDVVHDNQSLGRGLTRLARDGWPVVATVHHPLAVDRRAALEACADRRQEAWVRRWWSFVDVQAGVARSLPLVLTVSGSSAAGIVDEMGVAPERLAIVPVGVDPDTFRPDPTVTRVPGRLVAISSADVPLKGLVHLVEAMAVLRQDVPHAHLVVVARVGPSGAVAEALRRRDLGDAVRFVSGLDEAELVALHQEAEVSVVPSLYEGFSLPAVEAMACATPVVATTGGALPEVVGTDGRSGLLVPPADPVALARAIGTLLADRDRRSAMGAAARTRVLERFTWERCADGTVAAYRGVLADRGHRSPASLAATR